VSNYSEIYSNADDNIISQDKVLKVFFDIEENVVSNYHKYFFERVSHTNPICLINPISEVFQNVNITNKTPYSDDIIGSVIFYSCMLRHNDKKDRVKVKQVIDKFRKDFLYFPLNDADYQKMLDSALDYLQKIREIYIKMFDLGDRQRGGLRKNGKGKKVGSKDKRNKSFF
jgi:hypothetical protein